MNTVSKEIQATFQKLIRNLGWEYEIEDLSQLTTEEIYVEIYITMFPMLESTIMEIAELPEQRLGERIEYLIALLSEEILSLDLSHIRGELIAQGDHKHIINFIQLLYEISKMYLQRMQQEEERQHPSGKSKSNSKRKKSDASSGRVSSGGEQEQNEDHYARSAQGIASEFADEGEEEQYDEEDQQNYEEQQEDEEQQEEGEYIEEEDEYVEEDPEGEDMEDESPDDMRNNNVEIEEEDEEKDHDSMIDLLQNTEVDSCMEEFAEMLNKPGGKNCKGRGKDQAAKNHILQQNAQSEGQSRSYGQSGEVSRISEVSKSKESSEYDAHSKKISGLQKQNQQQQLVGRYPYQTHPGNEFQQMRAEPAQNNAQFQKSSSQNQKQKNYASKSFGMQDTRGYGENVEDDQSPEYEQYEEEADNVDINKIENIDREIYKQEKLYRSLREQEGGSEQYDEEEVENENEYGEEGPEGVEHYDPAQYNQMRQENYAAMYPEYAQRSSEGIQEQHEEEEGEEETSGEGISRNDALTAQEEEDYEDFNRQFQQLDPQMQQQMMMELMRQQALQEQEEAQLEQKYSQESKQKHTKIGVSKKKKSTKQKPAAQTVKSRPISAGSDYSKQPKYKTTTIKPVGQQALKRPQSAIQSAKQRVSAKSKSKNNSLSREHREETPEAANNHIVNIANYDESIEEVDEEPTSDNEIESKTGKSNNETRDQETGRDNRIYNVLSDNIQRVKNNLQGMNEDEAKAREKNTYNAYLNDYIQGPRLRKSVANEVAKKKKSYLKALKTQKRNDENLKREFDYQQQTVYTKLRDEKVNYLKKIHKIIYELEKKKMIEEKREFMKSRNEQNEQTRYLIESIENMYKTKIDSLKERHVSNNREQRMMQDAQKRLVKNLEGELRQDRERQIEQLHEKWRFEKDKFENLIRDDGFLEQKIMEIYKKYN